MRKHSGGGRLLKRNVNVLSTNILTLGPGDTRRTMYSARTCESVWENTRETVPMLERKWTAVSEKLAKNKTVRDGELHWESSAQTKSETTCGLVRSGHQGRPVSRLPWSCSIQGLQKPQSLPARDYRSQRDRSYLGRAPQVNQQTRVCVLPWLTAVCLCPSIVSPKDKPAKPNGRHGKKGTASQPCIRESTPSPHHQCLQTSLVNVWEQLWVAVSL